MVNKLGRGTVILGAGWGVGDNFSKHGVGVGINVLEWGEGEGVGQGGWGAKWEEV